MWSHSWTDRPSYPSPSSITKGGTTRVPTVTVSAGSGAWAAAPAAATRRRVSDANAPGVKNLGAVLGSFDCIWALRKVHDRGPEQLRARDTRWRVPLVRTP